MWLIEELRISCLSFDQTTVGLLNSGLVPVVFVVCLMNESIFVSDSPDGAAAVELNRDRRSQLSG